MRSSSYKLNGQNTNKKKKKNAKCDLDVTRIQAFNWTNAKTSNISTTSPLKITLFLCFQPSLTIAIKITPQTSFTKACTLHNINWDKFNSEMLWNAFCTLNHTEQWFHNNHANLHSKNKWVLLSYSTSSSKYFTLSYGTEVT